MDGTTSEKDLPPLADVLARADGKPHACNVCDQTIAHPGVCDDCGTARAIAKFERETMGRCRDSIPERFRWSGFRVPELRERVPEHAIREALSACAERLPVGLTLVGRSGRGKTSLACAILRRVHDAVTWESPWNAVRKASTAFYVSAPELAAQAAKAGAWGENPLDVRARGASLLVLDDVGQPNDKPDSALAVLFDRHDRSRPTIITTWMSRDQAAQRFGDGFARRAYERVIEC